MKGRILILKIEGDNMEEGILEIFKHKYFPGYDSDCLTREGIFLTIDEMDRVPLLALKNTNVYTYNPATQQEIKCKHFTDEIITKIRGAVTHKGHGLHEMYTLDVGRVKITYIFDIWAQRVIFWEEFKEYNIYEREKMFDWVVYER